MADKPDVNYRIVCQGEDGEAEIHIFDAIGPSWFEETITAKQFVKDLKDLGANRKLNVRINSPGGSIFDGTAIYNALRKHKGEVTVNIEGIALSMASVIAMAGDTVNMADNALMMVHNPQGMVAGEAKDLRAYADMMDKAKDNLIKAYTNKSGKTAEEMSALMDAETWMTAEEAYELGLVDAVTDSAGQMAAVFDLNHVLSASGLKVPSHVQPKLAALFSTPSKEPEMADKTPERVPATVQQLEALEGADDAFVVAQLKAGATLDEAVLALHKRLIAKLNEQQQTLANLQQEVEQLKAAPAPASDKGVEPVASKEHGKEGSREEKPWGADPCGFYKLQLKKLIAEGMSATNASRAVNRANPGLIAAMQSLSG